MLILLGLLSIATPGSFGFEVDRSSVYAALPVRDLSGDFEAARRLQDLLHEQLGRRGVEFARADELEQVMIEKRIRYTDSIAKDDAEAIAAATGARYLLTSALLGYSTFPDLQVAFATRVLDLESGERVLSVLVALRGADFSGLLGIGVIEDASELELEVVARVVEEFDQFGQPRVQVTSRRALRNARPSDWLGFHVDAGFDPDAIERVVVMPLLNGTKRPDAGVQFAEMLSHELFRAGGIQVVELSELRAALRRARVRSIDLLGDELLARVGTDLGTRFFVMGRIDAFTDRTFVDQDFFPEVEASIRVLDVETGRIVATASIRRRGDHYRRLLGLGMVRGLLQLADRTALELVALMLG